MDNRLKTASKTGLMATLAYDAEGRLRQTAIGSTTINLLNDAERLVAEYDAAGTTVLRKYVHGPGTDEPIVWYEGAGTTAKNWLYADHLGSVVATANGTGASTATYSYGPYGEPNVATGLRFTYTGQQLIGELGLYYYKARFYSPQLGRFLQTDPIGYKDDQNLYAYVGNNAINRVDPTGPVQVAVEPILSGSILSDAAPLSAAGQHGAIIGSNGGYNPVTDNYEPNGSGLSLPGLSLNGASGLVVNGLTGINNWIFARPANESRPTDAPSGTIPINQSGWGRQDVHDIKGNAGAGARDWTGIAPNGHVITTDPDGRAIDHGPADSLLNR